MAAAPFAAELDTLASTRRHVLDVLAPLTLAQVNRIPEGFNNNLVWNAAHCFVTQVLLTEGLSGLPVDDLPANFLATYRKGGRPTRDVDAEELAFVRRCLAEGPERLRGVLAAADRSAFRPYATSYGVELTRLGEAVRFNNVHEAMHYGVMLAQRRLV